MNTKRILTRLTIVALAGTALAAGSAQAATIQDGTSNIGSQSTGIGAGRLAADIDSQYMGATASLDRKIDRSSPIG